eukprot:1563810-Rhodomonas_salina.4
MTGAGGRRCGAASAASTMASRAGSTKVPAWAGGDGAGGTTTAPWATRESWMRTRCWTGG